MQLIIAGLLVLWGLFSPTPALAAANFSLSGSSGLYPGDNFRYQVLLDTDTQTLTSVQAVISFDNTKVSGVAIDARGTPCSFFAPADPSLGYGNAVTPYFYQSNKVVLSCGFSNPGFSSSTGRELMSFYLTPTKQATASGTAVTTSLSISNVMMYYIEDTVVPGASSGMNLTIYPNPLAATPTPTPTPWPDHEEIGLNDLNFVEISTVRPTGTSGTISSSTGQSTNTTNAVAIDDSIPPPPDDLEQRAPVTPFQLAPTPTADENEDEGEVLSVRSLRELLIPGKSNADKTIVLVNFVSLLAFLVILTILIWRLILMNKKNKLRYNQMKDLITGELSVMGSKFVDTDEEEQEYQEQLERLKKELETV